MTETIKGFIGAIAFGAEEVAARLRTNAHMQLDAIFDAAAKDIRTQKAEHNKK